MRWPDRAAFLAALAIALGGPFLIEPAARVAHPALCVGLAWEQADPSPDDGLSAVPLDRQGAPIADPWGRSLRWDPEPPTHSPVMYQFIVRLPVSLGPDGVRSADDVQVAWWQDWPAWQRVLVTRPRLVSLAAAAYLALAWLLLRTWRLRGPWTDALVGALVALPLAPVLWLAASIELAGKLSLMSTLAVPAPVATSASAWALAFVAALGVRVASRAGSGACG